MEYINEKEAGMARSISAALAAIAIASVGLSGIAHGQSTPEEMKQAMDALQRQMNALQAQMQEMMKKQAQAPVAAAPAAPPAAQATAGSHEFLERKPGDGLTFFTRGGELSIYGNLDLSLDYTTKGLGGMMAGGAPPVGNTGWMWDVSSNLSYVGVRGFQTLGAFPATFVYQLETQIDVSASSGTSASNSNTSAVVKGGLTYRNSFIGLAAPSWGAVKIGKTDAPYKLSTASMNPFSGQLGDYGVIMGNSGGDNRVEFGTRLSHAIWYESPSLAGFNFAALVSPGQNRANDNSNIASGEVDCSGGNIPGSGGLPVACNDGSFGAAYSASVGYHVAGLYVTGAYELHKGVNRTSDLGTFDPNDVANEHAAKVGASYRFPTATSVSAIYERLVRSVPASLQAQNERTRSGYWLAISQDLTPQDSLHFGWAHAGKTPGDPGQHNTPGGANPDNSANMFTLAVKHQVNKELTFYADFAETLNHAAAHYDLGAGGRGVTTDCHDASNPDTSGFDPNGNGPHCWAGGRLRGVSVGAKYTF
jgi:predicted porin